MSERSRSGATDLTQRALAGQVARAYGREAELNQLLENLLAHRSVLPLGPSDVGKTAILHEAIYRLTHSRCRKPSPAAAS